MSFDERIAEHRRRVEARLAALRAAHSAPGGRETLRALRRAAASARPRRPDRRRLPAITLAAVAVAVVVVITKAS